ncbi:MAG: hypothetical protein VX278_04080, partial [Myxococcota bacterium]|nr:hypothetical protein [Myxococcota bacterium]
MTKSHHKQQDLAPSLQEDSSSQQSSQKNERRNPFMQFLQDSGDWIADRYQSTASGIGDFAQNVGNSAKDLWEVITESSISMGENGLSVDTDLDEVLDILPDSLGVSLNREASDNRANIHLANDGTITIQSAALAIQAVNLNGITMNSGMLKQVTVTVRREKNGLIPTIDPEKSEITIQVAQVEGNQIQYQTGEDTLAADRVVLNNVHVVATGGKAPFDPQASGTVQFNVASAQVSGFSGLGASSSSISTEGLQGNIGEKNGSISAAAMQANNLNYQGSQVASASLNSVQGSFSPTASGATQANVSAG